LYVSHEYENKPVYDESIDANTCNNDKKHGQKLVQTKQTSISYTNENESSRMRTNQFENETKRRSSSLSSSSSSLKAIKEIVNNTRMNIKREKSLDQHVSSSPSSSSSAALQTKPASITRTVSNGQFKLNINSTANTNSTSSMHSRNACKKLKCPKCNWHYKYRETLDIHMREKHATDLNNSLEQQCIYCLDNAPHPRLGRGEQYKCGYKPYRCDICDYSTTTKGNLSIHMQSDKHVNNLKELQSTSNTTETTSSTALAKSDNKSIGSSSSSSTSSTASTTSSSTSQLVKNMNTIAENNEILNSIKSVLNYPNEESEEVEMEPIDSNQSKENLLSRIKSTTSTHSTGNYSFQLVYFSCSISILMIQVFTMSFSSFRVSFCIHLRVYFLFVYYEVCSFVQIF